jgi:hypothetical protein
VFANRGPRTKNVERKMGRDHLGPPTTWLGGPFFLLYRQSPGTGKPAAPLVVPYSHASGKKNKKGDATVFVCRAKRSEVRGQRSENTERQELVLAMRRVVATELAGEDCR